MKISLNHIHLVAKDKYRLFDWYEEYLNFKIIDDIEKLGEKGGPLFISSDDGMTAISIFSRDKADEFKRVCIPAFSCNSHDFLEAYLRFKNDDEGLEIFDHHIFLSFYPTDPEGTKLEITCLDVLEIRQLLSEKQIDYGLWKAP